MATCCKFEWQAKHFKFTDASPDSFQHLQWTRNRFVFLAYRLFMAGYCMGWFLYSYIADRMENIWIFVSNWTEGLMLVYFLFSFFLSIHAVVGRNKVSSNNSNGKLPWYYVINWLLSAVARTSGLQITLIYVTAIAPRRTLERNLKPITFHIHFMNSILLLLDTFMVAFPSRLLHFVYTVLYALLYFIFLLILHFTGYNSEVYPELNFANNAGRVVGLSILAVIVLPFFVHMIVFGLYLARKHIARKIGIPDDLPSDPSLMQRDRTEINNGSVNPSFNNASLSSPL